MRVEKDDELMALLLGEPSSAPPGDPADRHAAAGRDMTAAPTPVRGRRPGRRGLFVLAACAAVALLGTGTAYLVAHNGAVDGGSDALLTYEGLIACSGSVVEGTVERVEPAGGGDRYRIVLDVDRWYKPASGERRLAFTDEGANVPSYYRTGVRMLVLVSSLPGEGPESYRAGDPPYGEGEGEGEREGRAGAARDALEEGRLRVERALPAAGGLQCDGAG
ncbi:hypothetical protein ACH4ZX_34140 [Streptomyces sp. NPDC020490]|uniref:hypothetical protein n=1 Tax=Streptomyces sp. NPDC020490 TaxID=3365078 RepID=UPI0037A4DDE8